MPKYVILDQRNGYKAVAKADNEYGLIDQAIKKALGGGYIAKKVDLFDEDQIRLPDLIKGESQKEEIVNVPNAPKKGIPDGTYLCSDAWTSGNPGIGGYQVVQFTVLDGIVTEKKKILGRDFTDPHTNNFFELAGIGAALRYLKENPGIESIYSDSNTALSWIRMRHHKAIHDHEAISKMIDAIASLQNGVSLLKWDTEHFGEILADFGRKHK